MCLECVSESDTRQYLSENKDKRVFLIVLQFYKLAARRFYAKVPKIVIDCLGVFDNDGN